MSDDVELYVGPVAVPDAGYLAWQAYTDMIFAESDIYHRAPGATHTVVRQTCDFYYDDAPDLYHYLLAPAAVVRQRLLIHGYTNEFCSRAWEAARSEEVKLRAQHATGGAGSARAEEYRILECISLPDWLQLIRDEVAAHPNKTISGRENPWHFRSLLRAPTDVFVQLALLIEAFPKSPVWMECGYLYSDDTETRSPQQIARDEDEQYANYPSGKIIVLTEGKTDTRLITAALQSFYPEYAEAYQFLDFDEFRIEGGASPLARMIKVLSGARVQNRMIALFDNDAAGLEAYRSLKAVRFPRHVRLMLLPDTKLASSYPTLGPAGLARMDVNGAGASIELYLGRSSLTAASGEMRPVRWAQWMESVGRYQGQIQEKDAISKAFRDALAQGLTPQALRRRFPEMDLLLRSIFEAFQDLAPSPL